MKTARGDELRRINMPGDTQGSGLGLKLSDFLFQGRCPVLAAPKLRLK
jgi:hypothetical protein